MSVVAQRKQDAANRMVASVNICRCCLQGGCGHGNLTLAEFKINLASGCRLPANSADRELLGTLTGHVPCKDCLDKPGSRSCVQNPEAYYDRLAVCAAVIWPSNNTARAARRVAWEDEEYGARPTTADDAWAYLYELAIDLVSLEKKQGGFHNDSFPLHTGRSTWDAKLGAAAKKGNGGVSGQTRARGSYWFCAQP